jgi:hypothetical protein
MAFDPNELSASAFAFPFFQLAADCLHKVLVHDLAVPRLPSVTFPIDVPFGNALDRVLAVAADFNVLSVIDRLQST